MILCGDSNSFLHNYESGVLTTWPKVKKQRTFGLNKKGIDILVHLNTYLAGVIYILKKKFKVLIIL